MLWQIVEKNDFGTDWHLVRYEDRAIGRFDTQEKALVEAKRYLTLNNCNNALTKNEKLSNIEMFMIDDNGVYLGELDNEPWYFTYPKDIKEKDGTIKFAKGETIKNKKFFLLEGKTEVSVRPIPGT